MKVQLDESTESLDERGFWAIKLAEAKKGGYYFVVDNRVLIRRIPLNYEVVTKESGVAFYYPTFKRALKYAVDYLAGRRLQRNSTVEKLLESILRLEKKIDNILPDVIKSLEEYEERKEMFEDADQPVQRGRKGPRYYCTKCGRNHLLNHALGQSHLKYKGERP